MQQQNHLMLKSKRSGHSSEAVSYTHLDVYKRQPLDILSQLFSDDSNIYGLDDILSSIKKAKENENIKGIYLDVYKRQMVTCRIT